jgi:CubicO group peptidase (beta-lactamase class C family)
MRILILLVLFTYCKPPTPKKIDTIKQQKQIIKKSIDSILYKKIYRAFDSILVKNKFNGQILIAKDDNIILDSCIGLADLKDSSKIVSETQFHLASVSKTFTGMLCLKLYDEGKLDFDDFVTKYIPLFPYKKATIRQLLSHTSNLPDYSNFLTYEKKEYVKRTNIDQIKSMSEIELKYFTNQDIIDYMIKYVPSIAPNPNEEFHYCNTNYVTLAIIIEKITNMNYPSAMKKYIFDKYGLKNTFVFNLNTLDKYIPSYKENSQEYGIEKFDLIYGDKNVYSTSRDLLLWDKVLKSNDFLKNETLRIAYEPKSKLTNENKTYGYGWRLIFPKGEEKIIYHNGWWHGNNTAFVRLIKENAVIIILGNKYNNYIYSHKKFVDVLRNAN